MSGEVREWNKPFKPNTKTQPIKKEPDLRNLIAGTQSDPPIKEVLP